MKIVFYAINGIGLGHLSRCAAIARQVRLLGEVIGESVDIQFLTTSDADWVVQDFPVFKFPSKSVFRGMGGAGKRYASGAKLMLSNQLAWLRPDVLVVDTQSQGAFGEYHFLRDYAKKTVLIERHKMAAESMTSVHQAHLRLYDRVLVPDDDAHRERYPVPPEISPRFVGRVCGFDSNRAWSAIRVREHFGVGEEQRLIYVAAGGGGDPAAVGEVRSLAGTLTRKFPSVVVLAAFGPLAGEPGIYGMDRVITIREAEVWRYFPGVDLAISAAGYNSYEELLEAGVPALFFPQARGLDDQDERISLGEGLGYHGRLDWHHVAEQVGGILEGAESIDTNLDDRLPATGALNAAAELVNLASSGDESTTRLVVNAACFAIRRNAGAGFGEWLRWQKRINVPDVLAERLLELWPSPDVCPAWFSEARAWGESISGLRRLAASPVQVEALAARLCKRYARDSADLFHSSAEIVMGGASIIEIMEALDDPELDFHDWLGNRKLNQEKDEL
jgi:predicted glycosyltransferase